MQLEALMHKLIEILVNSYLVKQLLIGGVIIVKLSIDSFVTFFRQRVTKQAVTQILFIVVLLYADLAKHELVSHGFIQDQPP